MKYQIYKPVISQYHDITATLLSFDRKSYSKDQNIVNLHFNVIKVLALTNLT